jgi:hypothetical protein
MGSACQDRRLVSWWLLIAILPALTFLGHWPETRIDIPGTNAWFVVPLTGGHDDGAHEHAGAGAQSRGTTTIGTEDPDAHARHCHADAASCTDAPFTGASAFALLCESVALLGAAGVQFALVSAWWRPSRVLSTAPDLRPPRPLAFT